MNPLKFIARPFVIFGKMVGKAFNYFIEEGLSDENLKIALELVKEAADKFSENTEKREWVVRGLVGIGIPGPVARILVELAVKLWKKERVKLGPNGS